MESYLSDPNKKTSFLDNYFAKIHSLKPGDAFILKCLLLICVIFFVLSCIQLSKHYSLPVATEGGVMKEGVLGTPRYINPVLASTRPDKDLTALVYDGLMALGPDGVLIPNIAESVTVSDDGLTYNIILKKDVTFQDNIPLTASDVIFTIERIQDPLLKSPLRASLDGVRVEQVNDYELNFILPDAYSPFIENLTFGILPQHVWKDVGAEDFQFSQYNSEPIGSGPYMVEKIVRNSSGIPETYILKANPLYHVHAPKISTFELHFFPTEQALGEAFTKKEIQSAVGVDADQIKEYNMDADLHHLERIPLPRTYAVFINQNKSVALRDPAAREALNIALNRKELVNTVLGGYGNALTTPIPPGFSLTHDNPEEMYKGQDAARDILKNGGWKLNTETQIWEKEINKVLTPLSFSISTVNNSTFEATAEFLRDAWTPLGVGITIKQFEQSDLTQSVIRPRDYEVLLFGTQLGRALDYYSFWHSSQRNDPGLNVALYANLVTDSILSEMRRNNDPSKRAEAIERFKDELAKETPALFLYAPELLYVFPNTVYGASFKGIEEPHERFSNVYNWYIETEVLWPIFNR